MKKLSALAAALSLLAMSACGTRAPAGTPEAAGTSSPAPEQALSVRLETVTDTIEDNGVTLLTYSYPAASVTGSDSAGDIETAINARLKPSQAVTDSLAEAAQTQYGGLSESDRELWGGYGLYYTAEVTRSDGRVLSLYCTVSENSGGAHPNNRGFGLNFDVRTGALLTGGDIDAGSLGVLVRSRFAGALTSSEFSDSFYGVGEFVERVMDTDQWYFTADGLYVFANEDEIAPHAVGITGVELSYGELAGALDERYMPAA